MRALKSNYRTIQGIKTKVPDDLLRRFLEQVKSSPTSIAILTTEGSLTYQALYDEIVRWTALFTHHLQDKTTVVVCLDRTPRLVAVLLALQWLEITYIPVDLSLPVERLRTILEDSQAQAFLYDTAIHANHSNLACLQLNLVHLAQEHCQFEPHPRPLPTSQHAIAYIIYTSGSTGKPKGVAIPRYALNNFLAGMGRYFLQEDEAVVLAITTLAFDIANLELFLPLWQKKAVFLANEAQRQDPTHLRCLLNDYPITLLQATPAMWNLLSSMQWEGKSDLIALCGGEQLNPQLAKSLLAEVSQLWNMYGPTEATVWCSCKQIVAGEPITVGHPIDNTEMCVMDASHNILPPYVKGFLYIGGLCLASGYVNNKELTDTRFIPYAGALGGRLFSVGDIACTTPEGEFIIFGRMDNQIKLHGYRIELAEIEAHIQRIPAVRDCIVSVFNEQLVAYLCLSAPEKFSETAFKKVLSLALPEYMLPQRFILLDKLPLSTNGKIDGKALYSLNAATTHTDNTTTLTPMQLLLAHVWSTELGMPTLGPDDNFFHLGGHSLCAARIALKIAQQTNKQINAHDFYKAPTLAEFAKVVEQAPHSKQCDEGNIKTLTENRWLPLYDFQLMLWVCGIFEPSVKRYNNSARIRLQGPLDKNLLDLALQLVVQKQEILTYTINRWYPAQKKQPKWSIQWLETSLCDCDEDRCEDLLAKSFNALFFQPLSCSQAPMMVAKLFYLKEEVIELQICISHFLSDEDSMAIFFQELSNAYVFYAHHTPLNATESSQTFMSYTRNQNKTIVANADNDTDFWERYLEDTDFIYFPSDHIVKKINPKASYSTYYEIPTALHSKLHQFCAKNQLTITDVLNAAIGLSLAYCVKEDVMPAKLFANVVRSTRHDPDYDRAVGCFLNVDVIKLDWRKHKTLLNLAKQAHQSAIETLTYQRAPSMVKYAALRPKSKGKKRLIAFFSPIFVKLFCRFNLYPAYLNALVSLAFTKPKNSFLINVNIFSNFSADTKRHEINFFGVSYKPIPPHPYPTILVNNVFDVTFHKNGEQNKPVMVITSNLTAAFREEFGKTLLAILEKEVTLLE